MIGKPHEYNAMATCETSLWWYKFLHDSTLSVLKLHNIGARCRILDAGCGTGGLLKKLLDVGYDKLDGFDLSKDALTYARNLTSLHLKLCDITTALQHYPSSSFDAIISHDILCLLPLEKEKAAIDQLIKLLKPGGILIMNLPAFNAFRGTHDIAVGITRRYTKSDIKNLIENSANVETSVYWPFLLSVPIYLVRLSQRLGTIGTKAVKSDVRTPNTALNWMLYQVSKIEGFFLKSKPWGSSVFTVIRRAAS
jgi:SAM-dependent methyltransferase